MFTTAEEAHQATLQAWENILRRHGEVTPSLRIAIKAYLDLAYFPETALAAVAIYQGRTLCRARRGRITLLRAPHKSNPG
jgi:hypothetical protein